MATTIKTPTRLVRLALIDPETDLDWSGDYVGNQHDANLTRNPDGDSDYIASDDAADWWVRQCTAQQDADDALFALSAEDREAVRADARLNCDLEDQPGAIMAAIAELPSQCERCNDGEICVTHDSFVEKVGSDCWGVSDVTEDEHLKWTALMNDALPDNIIAEPCRQNEIAGTYVVKQNGNMQILMQGRVPDDLREVIQAAWEKACEENGKES